jgi:hypothetical protein
MDRRGLLWRRGFHRTCDVRRTRPASRPNRTSSREIGRVYDIRPVAAVFPPPARPLLRGESRRAVAFAGPGAGSGCDPGRPRAGGRVVAKPGSTTHTTDVERSSRRSGRTEHGRLPAHLGRDRRRRNASWTSGLTRCPHSRSLGALERSASGSQWALHRLKSSWACSPACSRRSDLRAGGCLLGRTARLHQTSRSTTLIRSPLNRSVLRQPGHPCRHETA